MEPELNLGEIVRALQAEYGESFQAGLEQGKEMMALTLQDRLQILRADADKAVEAAIEAHSIRWEGKTANLPIEQTGVNPTAPGRAEVGIWYL
jgi:hypothetical protein